MARARARGRRLRIRVGEATAHRKPLLGLGPEEQTPQAAGRDLLLLHQFQQLPRSFQQLAEPLEDRRGHPRPYFLEQCLPGLGRQQRPQFGQKLGRLHGASSLARKSLATGYTHSSLMEVRAPLLDLVPRPSERPTHRQLAAL